VSTFPSTAQHATTRPAARRADSAQLSLLEGAAETATVVPAREPASSVGSLAPTVAIRATTHSLEEWTGSETDAVVLALGFEERALESVKRVLAVMRPHR